MLKQTAMLLSVLGLAACHPQQSVVDLSEEDRQLLREVQNTRTAAESETTESERESEEVVDQTDKIATVMVTKDEIWLFTDKRTGCQYWYFSYKNSLVEPRIGDNGRHYGCRYDDQEGTEAEFTN